MNAPQKQNQFGAKPKKMTKSDLQKHNLANALALGEMGLYVFPSNPKTKRPIVVSWQYADHDLTDEQKSKAKLDFESKFHFPPAGYGSTKDAKEIRRFWNLFPDSVASISTGPSGLVVIDQDYGWNKDRTKFRRGPEKFAKWVKDHEIDIGENVFKVTTQSGGVHLYYRAVEQRITTAAGTLSSLDCDVRGIGGQTIAPGVIRPDGKTYKIETGDLSNLLDTPPIPSTIAKAIGTPRATKSIPLNEEAAGVAAFKEMEVPDFDHVFTDEVTRKYDLPGLLETNSHFRKIYEEGVESGSCADARWNMGLILLTRWPQLSIVELASFYEGCPSAGTPVSGKEEKGEYNERAVWKEHTKLVRHITSATKGESLTAVAGEIGPLPKEQQVIADAKAEKKAEDEASDRDKNNASAVAFSTFKYIDPDALPPREYIYRDWILKRELTVLVAPGGRGKSAWLLSVAIDLACGVDHLGAGNLYRPRKVMLYNTEDSLLEMQRRASSYIRQHSFHPDLIARLEKNLHLQSGKDKVLVFAKNKKGIIRENEAMTTELVQKIEDLGVEVLMADPLATLHEAKENAVEDMAPVAKIFSSIQSRTGVAMVIAHHTRKGAKGVKTTNDADDSRGSTHIVNSARIVLNINDLPADDAERWGIPKDECWKYFAMSKGSKSNLSPRDPSLVLYRTNSVQANNATAEYKADNTVALSWIETPKAATLYTDDDVVEMLKVLGDPEKPAGVAPQHVNYLGKIVAVIAGWDYASAKTKSDVGDLITGWRKAGLIREVEFKPTGRAAKSRRPIKVYVRGPSKFEPKPDTFGSIDDEE